MVTTYLEQCHRCHGRLVAGTVRVLRQAACEHHHAVHRDATPYCDLCAALTPHLLAAKCAAPAALGHIYGRLRWPVNSVFHRRSVHPKYSSAEAYCLRCQQWEVYAGPWLVEAGTVTVGAFATPPLGEALPRLGGRSTAPPA